MEALRGRPRRQLREEVCCKTGERVGSTIVNNVFWNMWRILGGKGARMIHRAPFVDYEGVNACHPSWVCACLLTPAVFSCCCH